MTAVTATYRRINNGLKPFVLLKHTGGTIETFWPGSQTDGDDRLDGAVEDSALRPELVARLEAYFDGAEDTFDDIPTPAGSPFFERCWAACRSIPRGETRSYAELAKMAGSDAGAARAAGQAMRRNPLPIIVPCHRVIATGGSLHGFSGSHDPESAELSLKEALLTLEGRRAPDDNAPLFQTSGSTASQAPQAGAG